MLHHLCCILNAQTYDSKSLKVTTQSLINDSVWLKQTTLYSLSSDHVTRRSVYRCSEWTQSRPKLKPVVIVSRCLPVSPQSLSKNSAAFVCSWSLNIMSCIVFHQAKGWFVQIACFVQPTVRNPTNYICNNIKQQKQQIFIFNKLEQFGIFAWKIIKFL